MIKLIASDLDGTLLQNGAQSLRPETCGLIHKLKEKGIIFVAASGRQYPNLQRLFAPVRSEIAYICENGCLTFYQGHRISKETMERKLGEEILRAIWEKDSAEILLSGENTCYIQPKDTSYYHLLRDVVKNHVTLCEDIFTVRESYMKISVYEKSGVIEQTDYWRNLFGDRVQVVTSGNEWLDMTPFGVHKGLAIRKIQEYLGIAPEECLAFGDNYNDAEMLREVGYPYAMDNAKPEILEMCPYHTARVEDTLEKILRGEIHAE